MKPENVQGTLSGCGQATQGDGSTGLCTRPARPAPASPTPIHMTDLPMDLSPGPAGDSFYQSGGECHDPLLFFLVTDEPMRAQSLQSCLTLRDPMDCSLPGSSVRRILQTRILEWAAMPSSRGSSQSRDQTSVPSISCIAVRVFTIEPRITPDINSLCNCLSSLPTPDIGAKPASTSCCRPLHMWNVAP